MALKNVLGDYIRFNTFTTVDTLKRAGNQTIRTGNRSSTTKIV